MPYRRPAKKFRSFVYFLISAAFFSILCMGLFQNITMELYWSLRFGVSTITKPDQGSATSGKLFQGSKVRSFPRNKIKFTEEGTILRKHTKKPPINWQKWAHQRTECKKWSVATTISQLSKAAKTQMTLPQDWCIVIVGDQKGYQKYSLDEGRNGRLVYLSMQDQLQLADQGIELSKRLPWNHIGRKNIGYLYAIASGAHLIWDFDDNNYLLSTPAQFLEPRMDNKCTETAVSKAMQKNDGKTCNSFNPMPFLYSVKLHSWPRGLPLVDIKAIECQPDAYRMKKTTIPVNKIAVYQSLASHKPDVDAIYTLTQPLPVDPSPVEGRLLVLVPNDAFAPFNAQSTLFTYEAFFMLFLPVTVHNRVSDIWRSYIGQKLLKDSGYSLVFTHAQVVQYRHVHNDLADFESERDLYLKSGKLIEYLKFNFTSTCVYSLECHFEALMIGLYEHNYIQLDDVYLTQIWIKTLLAYGYRFPQIKEDGSYRQPAPLAAQQESTKSKWPDLELFVPVFPGGESELNKILLRSLKFFWPKSKLKLLFLVDEDLRPVIRDPFAQRIKDSMERYAETVEVKFNAISKKVYMGRSHDRQQLLMFWADNYTNAEYVGFLDDDSLLTNHVLVEDIFDEKDRPHVWGRSNEPNNYVWQKIATTTQWTDKSDVEVMRTMSYFPVVVKTSHLKDIRASILKHHLKFKNFDDFFKNGIMKRYKARIAYSQFNIIHQHLWRLKRDEYNWHLQATSAKDNHFAQLDGVTSDMTFPKPRCALHVCCDRRRENPNFVEDIFRRGFCYSLTKAEYYSKGYYGQLCEKSGFTWDVVYNTPNLDQLIFEGLDWRWDNRTAEAHKKRIVLNQARSDWNEDELKLIFSSGK